jgi:hypothetical protein
MVFFFANAFYLWAASGRSTPCGKVTKADLPINRILTLQKLAF